MSIYLDHAATTPLHPAALEAMLPYLTTEFGNPSGSHAVSRAAKQAIEDARDNVAACLGCEPSEVVFTAGGTEADNMAVTGALGARGGVAVCSAVEHHAVLHPVEAAGGRIAPVTADGRVDLDELVSLLDDGVSVVSVLLANNEVGVVQLLGGIAELISRHAPNAVLHTDAVQGVTWLDVAALTVPAALVSIAAHKFGGPEGCRRAGRPAGHISATPRARRGPGARTAQRHAQRRGNRRDEPRPYASSPTNAAPMSPG